MKFMAFVLQITGNIVYRSLVRVMESISVFDLHTINLAEAITKRPGKDFHDMRTITIKMRERIKTFDISLQ